MNLKKQIGRQTFLMRHAFVRLEYRFLPLLRFISSLLWGLTFAGAVAALVCMTIQAGFDLQTPDHILLRRAIRFTQGIFITNVLFGIVFRPTYTLQNTRLIKWIVDIAILVTLLPWLYPHPENPWLPWLEQILYSTKFLYIIVASYSVVTLSFGLFRMIGRRTSPSLLLSGSFLVFILIGSFLLMLPKCTYHGISYVDSLFISTSAVSITGLTPLDVPATFTPLGIAIIAILIQIGALGVMTFTSFFAIFFSGNTSIYSQLMLKDMVYSKTMSALIPTLLYILGFTLLIEVAGAALIFLSVHGSLGMTTGEEIAFAAFHALSAFCNAGFSNLPEGLSNPLLLDHNYSIYWIMSALIIAGAIGFPILVNFRDAISIRLRQISPFKRRASEIKEVHLYNMNTKIVLVTFSTLFLVGAIVFFILEYNNSLSGMSLWGKITQSVFNSATPRSAGFASVSPSGFLNSTLLIIMFMMWIGGASQSTAGGIKVNTFAAIWLNLRAIVHDAPRVTAFRRTVTTPSIRRANAVVAISILSYTLFSFTLVLLEPDIPLKELLFESLSALFTVGSSLGTTPNLSGSSEILLCCAMFLGRVGIISLLTGIIGRRHGIAPNYPTDNIIIN